MNSSSINPRIYQSNGPQMVNVSLETICSFQSTGTTKLIDHGAESLTISILGPLALELRSVASVERGYTLFHMVTPPDAPTLLILLPTHVETLSMLSRCVFSSGTGNSSGLTPDKDVEQIEISQTI